MATTNVLALRFPKDSDTSASKTFETAVADLANDIDAFAGAWTTITPTVNQGASTNIAKTVNIARHRTIGKWLEWEMQLSITGTGTASGLITVTGFPAPKNAGYSLIGQGGIRDTSVPTKFSSPILYDSGSTTAWIWAASDGNGKMGSSRFTAAFASGDLIYGSGWYEIA